MNLGVREECKNGRDRLADTSWYKFWRQNLCHLYQLVSTCSPLSAGPDRLADTSWHKFWRQNLCHLYQLVSTSSPVSAGPDWLTDTSLHKFWRQNLCQLYQLVHLFQPVRTGRLTQVNTSFGVKTCVTCVNLLTCSSRSGPAGWVPGFSSILVDFFCQKILIPHRNF